MNWEHIGCSPSAPPGAERFVMDVREFELSIWFNWVADAEEGGSGFLGRNPWSHFVSLVREARESGITKEQRRAAYDRVDGMEA